MDIMQQRLAAKLYQYALAKLSGAEVQDVKIMPAEIMARMYNPALRKRAYSSTFWAATMLAHVDGAYGIEFSSELTERAQAHVSLIEPLTQALPMRPARVGTPQSWMQSPAVASVVKDGELYRFQADIAELETSYSLGSLRNTMPISKAATRVLYCRFLKHNLLLLALLQKFALDREEGFYLVAAISDAAAREEFEMFIDHLAEIQQLMGALPVFKLLGDDHFKFAKNALMDVDYSSALTLSCGLYFTATRLDYIDYRSGPRRTHPDEPCTRVVVSSLVG